MIQNAIATVEQFINPIDRVPFFASFSGMVRILAGAVQAIAGIVFAYLKSIFSLFTKSNEKIRHAINLGTIHCIHGLANVVRGAIAMIPVVNLVLAFYDYKMGRFNYPDETLLPDVYPIATARKLAQY
ncbi:MAG: hypothetical protein K1X28_00850 [Parachlamydiales bacterium]|nr:hypothetical protein [Parachlamydiales bacterium]